MSVCISQPLKTTWALANWLWLIGQGKTLNSKKHSESTPEERSLSLCASCGCRCSTRALYSFHCPTFYLGNTLLPPLSRFCGAQCFQFPTKSCPFRLAQPQTRVVASFLKYAVYYEDTAMWVLPKLRHILLWVSMHQRHTKATQSIMRAIISPHIPSIFI